jgi:PEP-CTERM motif
LRKRLAEIFKITIRMIITNLISMKSKTTNLGTLAALAVTAHAATVQITLTGNKISSISAGGNTLNADITGDLVVDLAITNAFVNGQGARMSVSGNGGRVSASYVGLLKADANFASGGLGQGGLFFGIRLHDINYLNPIAFTDSRINGGVATNAWLQVNAFNTSFTSHTVALTRVIFDDASTTRPVFSVIPGTQTEFAVVPEPGGLALLALGACGLLTRRKRQAARG